MADYMKVTYRDIAKMLTRALPGADDSKTNQTENYITAIKALPAEARVALKSAYIFSRKVPRDDREDMFQELVLAILKARTKDERFAYAIARCDWRNWWEKYRTREHYLGGSLNEIIEDSDGQGIEVGELIVGECEFEFKIDGIIEAKRIWGKLPDIIRPLVQKRLLGQALNPAERQRMSRFVRKDATRLLLA